MTVAEEAPASSNALMIVQDSLVVLLTRAQVNTTAARTRRPHFGRIASTADSNCENGEVVRKRTHAIGSMAATTETAGVAYMAHIGGFVAGLVLVKLMASRRQPAFA